MTVVPLPQPDPVMRLVVFVLAFYLMGAAYHLNIAHRINQRGVPLTGVRYVAFAATVGLGWPLIILTVLGWNALSLVRSLF